MGQGLSKRAGQQGGESSCLAEVPENTRGGVREKVGDSAQWRPVGVGKLVDKGSVAE